MMQIPSDISYVRKVSSEVENLLKSKDVDESTVFDIRLCVEEAVKNAIIHGNKKKKSRNVQISYSLEGDKFNMEIEDEGKGFDPARVPDPTCNENLLVAGGRGVFIIHKLMDEVSYKNNGKKIFMAKHLKGRQQCK